MGGELKNLSKVWIAIFASLTYCYFIPRNIPRGKIRFISLLPVVFLFTILPLNLSSAHFCGITAFFVTWLGNFKLLLFAFNKGPLSSSSSSISFIRFISVASLPIKIKPNPPHESQPITTKNGLKSPLNYTIKFLLFALVLRIYDYRPYLHPKLILVIYCCNLYLAAEMILAMIAVPARALLQLEIESQFDEPYLSTSLQDFWGRRWNLMVTSILRPTVYEPVRSISAPVLGKRWALLSGVMAAFLVSGLMHELLYYYLTRVGPTWEVTWFFVLHGVCTAMEIAVKNALMGGNWRINRVISGVLTIGFLVVSSFWLFFPQLVRNKVDFRVIREYGIVYEFVKEEVLPPLRLI